MELHETVMGMRFFERDVPRIAKALNTIAHELERANDINEGKHIKRIADELADVELALARLLYEYAK